MNARAARIGPADFEAHLYPKLQREAASTTPANVWEVGVAPEIARTLTLDLAARFAFDALEHFALDEPALGDSFANELLVIAHSDAKLTRSRISATARYEAAEERVALLARARILGQGTATRAAPAPAPRIINTRSLIASPQGKGTAMNLKDLINRLNPNPTHAARPAADQRVDPMTIIRSVLDEIDARALSWPDGRDLPHRVIVHLSQADFAYYGPRRDACEQHVEEAILDYATQSGALLEHDPFVTIKADPMLYTGQLRIEASFDEPVATAGTQGVAGAGARQNALPAHPRTQIPSAGRDACLTPEYRPAACSLKTPVYQAGAQNAGSVAKLMGDSFQSAVLPGDTVGRMRYPNRPKPDISLDGPEFEFVSQEQGSFSHDRDGWHFTSIGRNGTSVQRKGTWIKLADGERFALESGDSISFAKCAPLTFSVA